MRNAKRLLAALLLAAALILSSASCGGQTETASEAPAAASSEPQRDYTVQISKDTLRRTGLDITAHHCRTLRTDRLLFTETGC